MSTPSLMIDPLGSRNFLDRQLDRFILWVPVCLGLGMGLYFSLSFEPPLWALWGLLVGIGFLGAILSFIERLSMRYLLCTLMFIMAGFGLAQCRTWHVASPMVQRTLSPAWVTGEVEECKQSLRGYKILLKISRIQFLDKNRILKPVNCPKKIQITYKGAFEQPIGPGDWVEVKTKLTPVMGPVLPGTFDFRRKAFFQQIGASGIAFDVKKRDQAPTSSFRVWVGRIRQSLTEVLCRTLPDQKGAIAAALITGDTARLSHETRQIFADTGTSHILVIAGLHMSIIAGFIFLCCRGLFGLIPYVLNRYPARKMAVGLTMVGSFCYLNLSGMGIPTQRAFISFTLLMLGILWDRHPISMRSLAVAATLILCLTPEALMTPSFQLSFSVVAGLIAAYERTVGRRQKKPYQRLTFCRKTLRHVHGMFYTSFIASLAALPFTLYYFYKFTLQSVTGNMLAIPIMSVWVMPAALFSVIFSFWRDAQQFFLHIMGHGIDVMGSIIAWCARLPGAAIHLPHMPTITLLMIVAGMLWLCLWRYKWRWLGMIPILLSVIPYGFQSLPCVFISDTAKVVGVYHQGKLYATTPHTHSFIPSIWAGYRGVEEANIVSCTHAPSAMVEKMGASWVMKGDPLWVGVAGSAEDALALQAHVNVLISAEPLRHMRGLCSHPNLIIDRFDVWREGGMMVYVKNGRLWTETVREGVGNRPWALRRTTYANRAYQSRQIERR